MKKIFLNKYNLSLVFTIFIALWAAYSFFSYQIQELPDRLPDTLEKYLKENYLYGEPVILSEETLDQLVWKYPEYNIYPGGGKNAEKAAEFANFLLISYNGIPRAFKNLKDYEQKPVISEGIFSIHRFVKKDAGYLEYRSVNFFEKLKVTSVLRPEPSPLINGEYKTGPEPWNNVLIKSSDFFGKRRTAISAHPLGGADKFVYIELPPFRDGGAEVVFEWGVADSGECSNCNPVKAELTQDDKTLLLLSQDRVWQSKKLDGFVAGKPVKLSISANDAGKRHFHFDMVYRVKSR